MQLRLSPPADLRAPGDPEAVARHLDLLLHGGEPWIPAGAPPRREPDARDQARARLDQETRAMERGGLRYWIPDGQPWAARLQGLAPRLLFVSGTPDVVAPSVGIVGTRHPDAYGLDLGRRAARACARAGAVVVSGGALGIDRCAHDGALEGRGTTTVVLAGGLLKPHPVSHRSFFREVVEAGGCLVSEYPPGVSAAQHRFLERNRLVAAMSDALLVVQAGAVSGALNTAEWARRLAVPVFAVPGDAWYGLSAGAHELLRGGARPFASPADLESVPAFGGLARRGGPWPTPGSRIHGLPVQWLAGARGGDGPPLSDDARALLDLLVAGPRLLDDLADALGTGRCQGALLELEVAGSIRRLPGGQVLRVDGA